MIETKSKFSVISDKNTVLYFFFLPLAFIIWYGVALRPLSNKYCKVDIDGGVMPIKNEDIDECFLPFEENMINKSNRTCIDHTQQMKWLSCHLSINPGDSTEYVLVVGSSNPVARIFVDLLKTMKTPFREIKSRAHLDMSKEMVQLILWQFKIRIIMDFSQTHGKSYLTSFANYNRIPLFHLVGMEIGESNVYELVTHQPFGPTYLNFDSSPFMMKVFSILDHKNQTFDFEPDDKYVSASEVAEYLYSSFITGGYIATGLMKKQFKEYRAVEINAMMTGRKEMDLVIRKDLFYIDAMREVHESPYSSLSIVITNEEVFKSSLQTNIDLYEKVLPNYRESSFELIYIFVHTINESKTFWDTFTVGSLLKKHISVYEISYSEYEVLLGVMETNDIPYYFLKNVGFRLSKGEYIFSGTGNILPSPFFFDASTSKMFTPLAMYRGSHITYNDTDDDDDVIQHYSERHVMEDVDLLGGDWKSSWHLSAWMGGNWGSMQGGHRKMIESIGGYINDKYFLNVDTIFALDISAFRPPPLVLTMPHGFNVRQKIITSDSDVFPLFEDLRYMDGFCAGKRSNTFEEHKRSLWGIQYHSDSGTINVSVSNYDIHFIKV